MELCKMLKENVCFSQRATKSKSPLTPQSTVAEQQKRPNLSSLGRCGIFVEDRGDFFRQKLGVKTRPDCFGLSC